MRPVKRILSVGTNHLMKTLLIIVCGVLLYNSPGARNMTADALNGAADFIDTRPNNTLTGATFTIPNPFHTP